ncbi:MAG TPA: FAD-binding oxidoreductase [Chloroflexi bacterium]|nr:FAD-binding oxidoreductase [Chloroflexota bacterium]
MQQIPTACDVLIVGAGLTGALLARGLVDHDVRVVVLEAAPDAALGATARGAPLALLGTPQPYAQLVAARGSETAAEIWELTRQNLALLQATAQRLGQQVKPTGSLRLAGPETEVWRESAHLLQKAGFAVALQDAARLGYPLGLQVKEDLAFDPVALALALLDHPGIILQTETEVQQILPSETDLEIWAHNHYIRTKAVVLAGGAHSVRLHRGLGQHVKPLPVQAVACSMTEALPLPLVLPGGQVVTQAEGQWQFVGWRATTEAEALDDLLAAAMQFCPTAPVRRRPASWVGQSVDGLPVVGELPDFPRIYTVSGLGPWGFSWAFVATAQLLALMLEDVAPTLLNVQRFA